MNFILFFFTVLVKQPDRQNRAKFWNWVRTSCLGCSNQVKRSKGQLANAGAPSSKNRFYFSFIRLFVFFPRRIVMVVAVVVVVCVGGGEEGGACR